MLLSGPPLPLDTSNGGLLRGCRGAGREVGRSVPGCRQPRLGRAKGATAPRQTVAGGGESCSPPRRQARGAISAPPLPLCRGRLKLRAWAGAAAEGGQHGGKKWSATTPRAPTQGSPKPPTYPYIPQSLLTPRRPWSPPPKPLQAPSSPAPPPPGGLPEPLPGAAPLPAPTHSA